MLSTTLSVTVVCNVLINLLGMLGLLTYAWFLSAQRSRSSLESALLNFLVVMAACLGLRTYEWMFELNVFIDVLINVLVSLMPLFFLLYTERLMRRHAPFAIKVFTVGGAFFFSLMSMTRLMPNNDIILYAFVTYLVGFVLTVTVLLLTRNRRSLSPAENVMADAAAVSLWIMIPLFISEFEQFESIFRQRLGAIGALVFVVANLRAHTYQDRKRTVFGEMVSTLAQSMLMAICLYLVVGAPDHNLLLRTVVLAIVFVLLARIILRLRALELRTREAAFLDWVSQGAEISSLDAMIDSLRRFRAEEEYELIEGPELDGYDADKLLALIHSADNGTLRLADLKQISNSGAEEAVYAAEQCKDLMIKHGMNTACILRQEPPAFLLAHIPHAGHEEISSLEVGVIRRLARLMEQTPS